MKAHEVVPAIGNFQVSQGKLDLEIVLNIEALVAGIDLDGRRDTDSSALSSDYDELRQLEEKDLAPMVQLFLEDWLPRIRVTNALSQELTLSQLHIPEVADPELPRSSVLHLQAEIEPGASHIRVHWPRGSGALVLRQNGVEHPYTGYVLGGETTASIPLNGGENLHPSEVFGNYIPIGFDHILPKGLDHILFVLGLFFLSQRLTPLFLQVTCFALAHSITLALGLLGLVTVDPTIVEPLIAASIVFVAVENVFARRLHAWRAALIFCFGLLHGLGFASVLSHVGVPQDQFFAALFGFNVGVELGQLTVILIAYLGLGYWFGGHPKYRGRVAIPASVTIALIGGYWFFERVELASLLG